MTSLDTSPLEKIIRHYGISKAEFARRIGQNKSNVSQAFQNQEIKPIWIRIIFQEFPELNPEWLITGKGEMILAEENKQQLPKDEAVDMLLAELGKVRNERDVLKGEVIELKDRIRKAKRWI